MQHYNGLTNSEIDKRIAEQIHSERDRKIMRLRLIDGLTYDKIAEIMEMSPRYLRTLIRKLKNVLNLP
jgi:DNA-binding CsgD family transcriptional regulator